MARVAAMTIYAFGISALLAGAFNLIWPDTGLSAMGLNKDALPAYYGNALAAFAMGIYYILAAYQRNKAFFILTVPMRSLTTAVFLTQGPNWRVAAIWEGLGAASTGIALLYGA